MYEVLTQLKEANADSGNILKERQQKSTFGMTLQRILYSFNRDWGAAVLSVLKQAPE